MVKENYALAYKEVIELLKYFSLEDIEKIPENLIKALLANMDENYEYVVDEEKSFEEQEMLEETKTIFAIIARDYWATDYQRQRILAKEANDIRKEEEEKIRKYNAENLFKGKKKNKDSNQLLPMEMKEDNMFVKLIKKIKSIFKRNK